jgi:hypothetical protein
VRFMVIPFWVKSSPASAQRARPTLTVSTSQPPVESQQSAKIKHGIFAGNP